jgi:regulation of enolase protein 1 (concanavalin A-like superfamily)
MSEPVRIPWSGGSWTHPPVTAEEQGDALVVTAVEGSDAWRETYYGFVHDSEHGLLAPFAVGTAMEVEFVAEFAEQFDQAGVFVRASADRWVKAGVEFADGLLQLGAVVTDGRSDWSVAPVPAWLGRRVLVRVSRGDDALTVRAGVDGGPLQFVRVVPFEAALEAQAGPLVAAPTRAGLTVRFLEWRRTAADVSLH